MIIKYAGYEICISAKSKYTPEKGFTDDNAASFLNSIMVDHIFLADALSKEGSERNARIARRIREEDEELYLQLKKRGVYDKKL